MIKRRTGRHDQRNGLSLLEVILSALLVGFVLVGALQCAGGVIAGRSQLAEQIRAQHLAYDLLIECRTRLYVDPGTSPVFGPETGEPGVSRLLFDDADDYSGYTETPPKTRGGVVILALTGWQRDVSVEWVTPADPSVISATDQGLKRITVTVSHNGEELARVVGLKSRWTDAN